MGRWFGSGNMSGRLYFCVVKRVNLLRKTWMVEIAILKVISEISWFERIKVTIFCLISFD